jgi:hypothetical protein
MKRLNALKVLTAALSMVSFLGCKQRQEIAQSDVAGVTSNTLEQSGDIPIPSYDKLRNESDVVTASLFFTFAKGQWRMSRYSLDEAQRFQTPNQASAPRKGWDYGTRSFYDVQRWFFDTSLNGGLFTCIQKEKGWENPQAPLYRNTIRCNGPDFKGGKKRWRLTFYLSSPVNGAVSLGEAMASDQITLLNGHFYTEDARQAQLGARFSKVYGPAVAKFGEKASSHSHKYRIIVFNGCGSEMIEDHVFGTAKAISLDDHIEMVANRRYSNYGYFRTQIPMFFVRLARGYNWADLIKSFNTSNNQSLPVFRDNMKFVSDKGRYRAN